MYDNETGRFTTPDLLWSAFPAQTPYHYAYNSPLTYRDPSGLAPEKEKEREELMGWETNWGALYPLYAALWAENERRANQSPALADGTPLEYSEYHFGDRTGNSASYGFGYSYWTDGIFFDRSLYIKNNEGEFSYNEFGRIINGEENVEGRNFNLTTQSGVDPGKWLDGAQAFLDGYGLIDQGIGGAIAGVLSGIIDIYKGNYFDASMSLLSAVPIIGIVGDLHKAGKLAKNVGKAIHANSHLSLKTNWGYKLFTNEGTFLKNGITSSIIPENRYTKYFMSDKYMETQLFQNRIDAYIWEYNQNLVNPGPLNFERYIKRK